MSDTAVMHFRHERVRIETERHEIEGTIQLPNEGFRSRTTDFLNAHERDFLAITDVELTWLDASREPEHHDYLAQVQVRGEPAVREHLASSTAMLLGSRAASTSD